MVFHGRNGLYTRRLLLHAYRCRANILMMRGRLPKHAAGGKKIKNPSLRGKMMVAKIIAIASGQGLLGTKVV